MTPREIKQTLGKDHSPKVTNRPGWQRARRSVVRILLRASGPAFTQAAEGFFRVAYVCPIPDRPG